MGSQTKYECVHNGRSRAMPCNKTVFFFLEKKDLSTDALAQHNLRAASAWILEIYLKRIITTACVCAARLMNHKTTSKKKQRKADQIRIRK